MRKVGTRACCYEGMIIIDKYPSGKLSRAYEKTLLGF